MNIYSAIDDAYQIIYRALFRFWKWCGPTTLLEIEH